MKRVLVTGASGFIGRWALAPLVARGFEVHAVHVGEAPDASPGVTWHRGDLLAPGGPDAALETIRPTHLLHFAWYAEHRVFWTSPENLRWVAASLALVRAFTQAGGRRAVMAGTCAEYDPTHGWCSERVTPAQPRTLYGTSKDALRRVVESYAAQERLSWAWGRIFLLHGPHEHHDRLIPAVTTAMLRGQPTRCTHGLQVRDFMHVTDVAEAFVALLDSEVTGVVNVASGEPRSLRDVVRTVAEIIGAPHLARFGDVPAQADDPPLLVADVRRLRDEVGFSPRLSMEEGLRSSVEWWRGREEAG